MHVGARVCACVCVCVCVSYLVVGKRGFYSGQQAAPHATECRTMRLSGTCVRYWLISSVSMKPCGAARPQDVSVSRCLSGLLRSAGFPSGPTSAGLCKGYGAEAPGRGWWWWWWWWRGRAGGRVGVEGTVRAHQMYTQAAVADSQISVAQREAFEATAIFVRSFVLFPVLFPSSLSSTWHFNIGVSTSPQAPSLSSVLCPNIINCRCSFILDNVYTHFRCPGQTGTMFRRHALVLTQSQPISIN